MCIYFISLHNINSSTGTCIYLYAVFTKVSRGNPASLWSPIKAVQLFPQWLRYFSTAVFPKIPSTD